MPPPSQSRDRPSRWKRATPAERDYLRAMADDGEGPSSRRGRPPTGQGQAATGRADPVAKLIHKGLLYAPEHGLIAYTVPGMSAFIARKVE